MHRCSYKSSELPPTSWWSHAGSDPLTSGEGQQVLAYAGYDGEAVAGDLILIDPGMQSYDVYLTH